MPINFRTLHKSKVKATTRSLAAKRAAAAAGVVNGAGVKLRRVPVPGLDLQALGESILEARAYSRARRASDEISQELMSTPVSV